MVSLDVPASDCHNMTKDETNYILGSASWDFDGSSSYVDLTDTLIRSENWASGGDGFTVAFWWRTGSYNYVALSQQCLTSTETELDYINGYESSSTAIGSSLGSTTYHDDNWHHLTVRWNGTNIIANIDDNFSTGSPNATGVSNITPPTWNTTTSTMSLGAKFNAPNCTTGAEGVIRSAYVLDGQIDDFGIWNRVLTDDELEDLWNSGSGATVDSISTTDLLVYYNFEQAVDDGLTNQAVAAAGNITLPQIPQPKYIINSGFKS